MRPQPLPYNARAAMKALIAKEILRVRKIALQTVLAPILTSVLYLLVFGELLNARLSTFEGVSYIDFLIPGLVMMALLQNSFGNSASSLLHAKVMGSMVFVLLPPYAGFQLSLAYIAASVIRGVVVGLGVFAVTSLWSVPPVANPLWILAFGLLGSVLMGALGVVCGLWAEKFDQMGAFQTFVIMPLTFLSGVFYSVRNLPPFWSDVSFFNPFFYLIDGFRYGFFAQSDFNPWVSLAIVSAAALAATTWATVLFVRGYKLKP